MSEARIMVRFTHAGIHHWDSAPRHRNYLSVAHRHLFHFEVECAVAHDDREIEFHDLLDEALAVLNRRWPCGHFGPMSCETIGRELGRSLAGQHLRAFKVTVWEDGECGASVEVPAPASAPAAEGKKEAPAGHPAEA